MDTRCMVFGIQESGKTTFAAALWHLVDSEEIPTALRKGRHAGDFTYLQEISGSWAEGYEVERTKLQQVENIRVNLLHPPSGNQMCLAFDDLSGETLEQAFATRYCPEKFVELVNSAESMLLFLSANRNNDDGVTILDVFDAEEDESQPTADPNHWEPKKAPLQVQLVDLLQCLQRPPFEAKPMKVALVVSAWDLVPDRGANAEKWLNDRYPLLSQYLANSDAVLDLRIYGVSAQGGRLSKKKDGPGPDREKLLAIVPASKRIRIVGPDVAEHDITRPLLWLAGLEAPV
jgi:Double-GTPase 1